MAALDAWNLAERLRGEQRELWLHLEATSPLEKYPAKQHARSVQEKLGVSDGLIYLPGQPSRNNEDSDMPAAYRQRRYFYYLSGCNEPDCHLTYDINNDTLTLFIPRIDPRRVIWNGRGSTRSEAMDKYDIDQVAYVDKLHESLVNWSRYRGGSLYILHSAQNPLPSGTHQPTDSDALQPAMNLARMIKDDHEISLIKKANDISSQAHREVLANIMRFKNEAQVEGLFLNVCIANQAKDQAYAPIAASGPNAGTLHYDDNNEDFEDRQLMCLDAGCEWELYASDITRTFPLSGQWPSKECQDIYRLVERMQGTCIDRLAPGVRYLDLHILAHQIAIDGLLSLGILHNGTREEIYKAGTSKAFFPHGLGHHVGLEVHDVGQADLMSMRKGKPFYEKAPSLYPENFHLPVYDPQQCRSPANPQSGHLEEGMVVTVEPGIYFSTYALNTFYLTHPVHSKYINPYAVKKYLPVGGVRIEDNILITSKGHTNLTTAPKGEAMLEIIRSQNAQWPLIPEPTNLRHVQDKRTLLETEEDDAPLLRAPGICREMPEPILGSIARAATLPVPRKDRKSVDFEPFEGPSLFSNFQRASTIDIPPRRPSLKASNLGRTGQENRAPKSRTPICGEDSSAFEHAYIDFLSKGESTMGTAAHDSIQKPACKKCSILMQTMGRLRENLSQSPQMSPKLPLQGTASRKPSGTEDGHFGQIPVRRTHDYTFWKERSIVQEPEDSTAGPQELDDIPVPPYADSKFHSRQVQIRPAPSIDDMITPRHRRAIKSQNNPWGQAPIGLYENSAVDISGRLFDTVDKRSSQLPNFGTGQNPFKNLDCRPNPFRQPQPSQRSTTLDSYQPRTMAAPNPTRAVTFDDSTSPYRSEQTPRQPQSISHRPSASSLRTSRQSMQSMQPQQRETAREDQQGRYRVVNRASLARASLPVLRSNDARGTTYKPASIPEVTADPVSRTVNQPQPLHNLGSRSNPCALCRRRNLPCDRSSTFPCPPCSSCSQRGKVCSLAPEELSTSSTDEPQHQNSQSKKRHTTVSDQQWEDVRKAMDALWKVRDDMERAFGPALKDDHQE